MSFYDTDGVFQVVDPTTDARRSGSGKLSGPYFVRPTHVLNDVVERFKKLLIGEDVVKVRAVAQRGNGHPLPSHVRRLQ